MKAIVKLLFFIPLLLLFLACSKNEGEGGMNSITGKLVVYDYDKNFTTLLGQRNAADEDVFIIYGDSKSFNDKIETNHDGSFCFNYLRKGDYTVYVYSEDISGTTTEDTAIINNVTFGGKKEEIDLGTIEIYNSLDYDDGTASISGKVYKTNYNSTFTSYSTFPCCYYAPDVWVYLVYGNETNYFERVRTNFDGEYRFSRLIKGDYTLYAYSDTLESATYPEGVMKISVNGTIAENGSNIEVPDLNIND